ncbi:ATP-binding protein [Thermodesulfobacteriota bacterium]
MMNRNKISFKLKNRLSELNRLCRNLNEFGKLLELSPKDMFKINIAADEHFTNIISHGYRDNAEHWIEITLSFEDEKFMICIEDDGVPFNPCEAEEPELECCLEERQVGGLGVLLTKQFMDEIVYQRCGNKNVLIMKKHL